MNLPLYYFDGQHANPGPAIPLASDDVYNYKYHLKNINKNIKWMKQ